MGSRSEITYTGPVARGVIPVSIRHTPTPEGDQEISSKELNTQVIPSLARCRYTGEDKDALSSNKHNLLESCRPTNGGLTAFTRCRILRLLSLDFLVHTRRLENPLKHPK